MVQVYFIRHAESEYNLAKSNSLDYYKKDCCLTENGIHQAKKLGKKLSNIHFDRIYISPLKRTLETFKYYNINCKNTCEQVNLKNNIEINELFREYITHISDLLEHETIDIFETEQNIIDRVNKIKTFFENINVVEKVAVFTHADLIFYLSSIKINGELFGEWISNAEYIIIEF